MQDYTGYSYMRLSILFAPEVLCGAGLPVAEGDRDVPVPLEELALALPLAGQGRNARHALPGPPPRPPLPGPAWLLRDLWR